MSDVLLLAFALVSSKTKPFCDVGMTYELKDGSLLGTKNAALIW